MTARRGWCPGVFAPMQAADGLLVRIKPRLGILPASVARRVAEASAAFGNGRIELTSRANLQLRGLNERDIPDFIHAMVACGAADADAATERRRNIIVSPLAGDDPSIHGRPEIVAAALRRALADATDLALPDKFGFAVDGGGLLPLGDTPADVVVRLTQTGCHVRVAGAERAIVCAEAVAGGLAVALARGFLAAGGTRRMRDLVASRGEAAIYETVGRWPMTTAVAGPSAGNPSGIVIYPGGARCALIVSPWRGELSPGSLKAAAAFADAFGDGRLRVSPWRSVLIGGVRRGPAVHRLAFAA